MIDLTATIKPKSDQLNADDLIAGPRTITVTSVKLVAEDQPVAIHFHGDDGKPYKPCKSMRRVLVRAWGPDGSKYVGRSLTLYLDESVKFGGAAVGGIRISEMSHISAAVVMALTATRGTKKAFTVKPMIVAPRLDVDEQSLLAAGNAASSEGVAMYREWLDGLTEAEKSVARPHHTEWSATAKAADAKKKLDAAEQQQQTAAPEPVAATQDDDERAYQQALAEQLAKEDQASAEKSRPQRRERGGLGIE